MIDDSNIVPTITTGSKILLPSFLVVFLSHRTAIGRAGNFPLSFLCSMMLIYRAIALLTLIFSWHFQHVSQASLLE